MAKTRNVQLTNAKRELFLVYSGTLVLKLNLFWKTVWETICSKTECPSSVAWETRDWSHRHLTQALEGKSCQVEERPGVLLDNQVSLSVNNRVGAELTVWEPRHSGTRVGLYVHRETRGYAGWSSLQKTLRPIRRALHPSAASLSKWLKASEHHPCITLITSHPGQNSTRFMVSEE